MSENRVVDGKRLHTAPTPNVSSDSSLSDAWPGRLREVVKQETSQGSIVIVGVGHPLRADDYVGSLIAKDLAAASENKGRIRIVDAEDSPENLLRLIWSTNPKLVLIIDALDSGNPPGSVVLIDIRETSYPYFATHNIPMRILFHTAPEIPKTLLLGIQPASREIGEPLSVEVEKARMLVAKELQKILGSVSGLDTG